ncbi:MAG: hypothetical protein ABIN97_14550 [Ginsengibacter sp.]
MNEIAEELYIKRCIQLIEERLSWGPGRNWVNYDFEKLSSAIEEKIHVILSVTTLKRIWGKVKYNHSPTLTTLNTLAKFLDFEDWRSFTNTIKNTDNLTPALSDGKGDEGTLEQTEVVEEKLAEPKRKQRLTIPVSLISGVLLLSATLIFFSAKKDTSANQIDSSKYQFKADKIISEGVPNSVVFTYDASAAKTDSIYIIQTWDIRRQTLVSKNNTRHSAIYYYPGFFRTKLIIDGTVVKTHDLQITSNGWLCLAEKEPVPLYFNKEEYQKNDRIEIDKDILKKYNLSLNPDPPGIRFFNQRDLGDLMNDNFIFETTLKNEFSAGSNACQYVEVLIQCKDDIIIIPLAAKACAGDIRLYAAGKELKSKEADLSGFGANLNEWTTIRVETKNKKMNFIVNNMLAASFVFPNDPSGIVGVQYRFNGIGAVRNTWFENKSGRVVMD